MTIINKTTLEKYYAEFDPFEFKYKVLIEKYADSGRSKLDCIQEFQVYENSKKFSALTECTYDNLKENLKMIYRDDELTKLIVRLYEMIKEKIIQQYINVDGLERLFSQKYADFEWEMHLGMDHDAHSMTFYRDHFVHQIRDAYTMDVLLSEHGFLEKISHILRKRGNGPISMYVCNMIDQQWFKRNRIFDDVDKKALQEHFLRNIIYMSSYMAGLFHDIGYPVVMNMNENRKIIDYLAEMYVFMGGNYNFNRITSLLQNSLLFRVVKPKEIRNRIEGDKPDHGTVSALLFLLHFYENGAVYTLEPYKLCAVELAALAIYNHTNRYHSLGQKDPDHERCICALNPISYLLRVADDLQEWGRIYFEVSKASQIMLCSKCHMPLIHLNKSKYGEKTKLTCESCSCPDDKQEALFAYDNFPRRKLYNITVCKNLRLEGDFNNKGENCNIYLDYRLDRLLQIAFLSPTYAEHCIEELNHMKHLFVSQYRMGVVFVDYVLTNNIIFIKSRIVGEYYERVKRNIGISQIKNEIKAVLNGGICKAVVKRICKQIKRYVSCGMSFSSGRPTKQRDLYVYLKKVFSIYMGIYFLTESVKELNTDDKWGKNDLKDKIEYFVKVYQERYPKFFGDAAGIMMDDIAVQIEKLYANMDEFHMYPDKYFHTFEYNEKQHGKVEAERRKKRLRGAAKEFADGDRYSESVRNSKQFEQINAFSDLYWIQQMMLEIRKSDEEKYEV